jgi:hypothetical protein
MHLTEKQMAEKWCPHVRSDVLGVRERLSCNDDRLGKCIGSNCSQWRWAWRDADASKSTGYCGLAGVPTR